MVKERKADRIASVKTQSCGTSLPPGHWVLSPGDAVCPQEGPGPSPWYCWPQGWWGCSGWEALAWPPSAASVRWYGGWYSSEELLWGLLQDPERLSKVKMGNELGPGAREQKGFAILTYTLSPGRSRDAEGRQQGSL